MQQSIIAIIKCNKYVGNAILSAVGIILCHNTCVIIKTKKCI